MPDEYIKRSDALEIVENMPVSYLAVAFAKGAIKSLPCADVAPVRRGKWTFDPLGGDWKCSECDLHSMEHGKYCPNCGTKMDKEGE